MPIHIRKVSGNILMDVGATNIYLTKDDAIQLGKALIGAASQDDILHKERK